MDRRTMLIQVLDELTLHAPSGFMKFMRRWPSGPVSLVHLQVLMLLDGEGPQAMHLLAEALDVSQASATGIIDRMEQRGLVTRVRDAGDRRVIRVALTDPGRQLLATIAAERRERLALVLAELSDDELEGFLRGSQALRRARERLLDRLPAAAHAFADGTGPAAARRGSVPTKRGAATATNTGRPKATRR
ncbi:MAG: MarR family transcriptional regulator [Chloroflexota bacterium]|nr:MAG: MarR family transcriptional regulator [Chloroflexota bacterium]